MWLASVALLLLLAPADSDEPPYWVEKLTGNLQYASSVRWFKDGYLLIADLPAGKVMKVDGEGSSLFRQDAWVSAMEQDSEGRAYYADPRAHRITRIDKKGKVETVADKFEGRRLNGPSGLAMSKNNHLWFTDSAFATADKEKELTHNGVYHLTPKGELSLVANGKSLYVVDSDARTVVIWDIDRQGAASNQRVLTKTKEGVPNGIMAAPDGRLFVAGAKVEVYSPTGAFQMAIEISEKPSDMVFGDADLTALYVAARTSVYRVRFKPQASGGKTGKGN